VPLLARSLPIRRKLRLYRWWKHDRA
jgi:hypothetical protein